MWYRSGSPVRFESTKQRETPLTGFPVVSMHAAYVCARATSMETPRSPLVLDPAVVSADVVARHLGLEPLDQEGGWFRRTYVSDLAWPPGTLPAIYEGRRQAASAIYALFTPDGFSAMHRLITDEIWCFHAGDPLESLRLHPDGAFEWVRLGLAVGEGQRPQDVVMGHVWQGTRLAAGGRWALVSCVMAPEFAWADFELGDRAALAGRFPEAAEGIAALTRDVPPVGQR